MTALGQKQTSRHVRVMSVIPLKADIHRRGLHVGLVPIAPPCWGLALSRLVWSWINANRKQDRDMHGPGWLWLLTGLAIGAIGVGIMSAIHMWRSGRNTSRTAPRDNYRHFDK